MSPSSFSERIPTTLSAMAVCTFGNCTASVPANRTATTATSVSQNILSAFLIIPHVEPHIPDFYLLDMEDLLRVLRLVRIGFLESENPAEIVCAGVSVSAVLLVLQHEIHLGIVYEGPAKMKTLLLEQTVKRECGDYVICAE